MKTRSSVLLLAAVLCCDCGQPSPSGYVARQKGGVFVAPAGGDTQNAQWDHALFPGDVVSTGRDGAATLAFVLGYKVELGPNTSILIQHPGSGSGLSGIVILDGVARVAGGGQQTDFSLGSPSGVAYLGEIPVDLLISTQDGMRMLVGRVEVQDADGGQTRLEVGYALLNDGTVVPVSVEVPGLSFPLGDAIAVAGLFVKLAPKADMEHLVMEPSSFVLLAHPKHTQVRLGSDKTWRRAKKRMELHGGDAVRTRRAGAIAQFGERVSLSLKSGAEVDFSQVLAGDMALRASYVMKDGVTRVVMLPAEREVIEHHVEAAGTKLLAMPGIGNADVEIALASGGQKAIVKTRQGKVVVGEGATIEAGRQATLVSGAMEGEITPIAATNVVLRPRSSVIIHIKKTMPPVEFELGDGSEGRHVFELSAEREFRTPMMRENLGASSVVIDTFKLGRYYWRVKEGNDWARGIVSIVEEVAADCEKCQRNNLVYDTGEKTVVYYQQALPGITLRWDGIAGASSYVASLFVDGEFDTPKISREVNTTELPLRAGSLSEGKYYWQVRGVSSAGKEVAAGRMNSLQIAYDNVITALIVKSPEDRKVTDKGSLETMGDVELGSKLFLNGRRVSVDERGRFRENVPLRVGQNTLVFRLLTPDGVERYYLRSVTRR